MNTKIIYISGGEVFDMADIRAAFDEVRAALSLDEKTVLFGVPVDQDSAFSQDIDVQQPIVVDEPVVEKSEPVIPAVDESETHEPVIDEPSEKPAKPTRRTRAKVVPITPVDVEPEPVIETPEPSEEKSAIPILSVLGAKSTVEDTPIETDATPIEPQPIDDAVAHDDVADNINPQTVSISDMLADDAAPVDNREKTLEELLESMTPLGEDEKVSPEPVVEPEPAPVVDVVQPTPADDDTDVTLELLATEFAESADKIVTPPKPETRGKIGKLKNILPFKKAKRDDSGIMGDLFGWAGVANDEDFTIPGFFANATSKK